MFNFFVLKNGYYIDFLIFFSQLRKKLQVFPKRTKRKIKRKSKEIWKKLINPKIFYKIFYKTLFLLLVLPWPKRTWKYIKTFYYCAHKYSKIFFYFTLHNDVDYKNFVKILKIYLIFFFFIKLFQEVYYNFTCPLATYLYGELKKYKMSAYLKQRLAKKQKKIKKVYKTPFFTKAEKLKIQKEKDEKTARLSKVAIKKLKKRRNLWEKAKTTFIYKKSKLRNKFAKKFAKKFKTRVAKFSEKKKCLKI